MITISKTAAKQIKLSMEESGSEGLSLRLAARRLEDGSLDYAMGFDETDHNDSHSRTNGVDIVVAPTSTELLRNAHLDYVEIEDDVFRFIFINPNDPDHQVPEEYTRAITGEEGQDPIHKTGSKGVIPDQNDLELFRKS